MLLKIYSACSVLRGGFCVLFTPVFWSNIVRLKTHFTDSINMKRHTCAFITFCNFTSKACKKPEHP